MIVWSVDYVLPTIVDDVIRVELFAEVLNEMRVLAGLSQVEGRPPMHRLAVQADLLGEEVEKDVDMTTHSRHMQVRILIRLFLIAVGAPVNELLDALV